MNATEIYELAERIACRAQRGEIKPTYSAVASDMVRDLWGLDDDTQYEIVRLARRGKISPHPANEALTADSPEWAAAVRLVYAVVTVAMHAVQGEAANAALVQQ